MSARQTCSVSSNEVVAPQHHVLSLECEIGNVAPGQFVQIGVAGTFLPRPFSILSSDGQTLAVLSKVVGAGTRLLYQLRPGDSVAVLGPLGRGFSTGDASTPAILVGGGVGIPPLFALAATFQSLGRPVTGLLGARTAGSVLLATELEAKGVTVRVATDDGSQGLHGTVVDLLTSELAAMDVVPKIYACGPPQMLRAVALVASGREVPCQVAVEANMACGFGACQGCAVPEVDGSYSLVCRDGPVFDARRLRWD